MTRPHRPRRTATIALAAGLAFWLLTGPAPAATGTRVVEGCALVGTGGHTETCAFTAHAPDEMFAAGQGHWQVTVRRGSMTQVYGAGDEPQCFLEGAAGTGRDLALCDGIKPGDVVDAALSGTGTLVIGNLVCAHDPLCQPD